MNLTRSLRNVRNAFQEFREHQASHALPSLQVKPEADDDLQAERCIDGAGAVVKDKTVIKADVRDTQDRDAKFAAIEEEMKAQTRTRKFKPFKRNCARS
jgi:hypothetical protein